MRSDFVRILMSMVLLVAVAACDSGSPQAGSEPTGSGNDKTAAAAEAGTAESAGVSSATGEPAVPMASRESGSAGGIDKVLAKLRDSRPDFEFGEVTTTPVEGIYQTKVLGGPIIYIVEGGEYFFAGDMFLVEEDDIVNLAERAMDGTRKEQLASLSTDDMIVFTPDDVRAHVYVFTDVDCYYCQKLHQEVPALNELGIEVRYLAYPRAGVGSPSYRKIASAWCADDPNDAITLLKAGETIPDNVCEPNPVAAQFQLGGTLGVTGTPALVTAEGRLVPGYMPADRLAQELGL